MICCGAKQGLEVGGQPRHETVDSLVVQGPAPLRLRSTGRLREIRRGGVAGRIHLVAPGIEAKRDGLVVPAVVRLARVRRAPEEGRAEHTGQGRVEPHDEGVETPVAVDALRAGGAPREPGRIRRPGDVHAARGGVDVDRVGALASGAPVVGRAQKLRETPVESRDVVVGGALAHPLRAPQDARQREGRGSPGDVHVLRRGVHGNADAGVQRIGAVVGAAGQRRQVGVQERDERARIPEAAANGFLRARRHSREVR